MSAQDLLVLFDLDGTLVASAPDIANAINIVLTEAGATPMDVAQTAAHVGHGAGAETLIRKGFALSGRALEPDHAKLLLARYFEVYLANICIDSRPYDGCVEMLETLAGQGYPLAVCTNKPTRHSEALLGHLNIAKYFKAICGRDAFAAYKPDRRHVDGTILAAGGRLGNAVLIGDSVTDLGAAQNAGIPLVLCEFGYGASEVGPSDAAARIAHFDQLAEVLGQLSKAAA